MVKADETRYHLAYRNRGGTWTGDGWAPEIRIHITRLLHGVIEEKMLDPGGVRAWIYRRVLRVSERLWVTWLYVELHEWLHALGHRWKIERWSSEAAVTWGAHTLLKQILLLHGEDSPFLEADFRDFELPKYS